MDRIDLHVEVPSVPYDKLKDHDRGEASDQIRGRVDAARARQHRRFRGTDVHSNAQMRPADLRQHCELDDAGHQLLQKVVDTLGMSARGYDRILKVARTIADLSGSDEITPAHLAEAIQYRTLDRNVVGGGGLSRVG
jgi:magnesium chelatase family protein